MRVGCRTERWRYTAWFEFDWGEGGDPQGVATRPHFDQISARELYDHQGDTGDRESGETFEWENLAHVSGNEQTVAELHSQLVAIIKTGLVKPMKQSH